MTTEAAYDLLLTEMGKRMDAQFAQQEFNALVAEKVMGLDVCRDHVRYMWIHTPENTSPGALCLSHSIRCVPIPAYSEEIAAAWLVVEKMHELKFNVAVNTLHDWIEQCECTIWLPDVEVPYTSANASTAPMAICKAALAAVGVEL